MTKPTEPKRRNAATTRARILQAAYECFSLYGFSKTGVRDIALKADVASSLVLRYFGTKLTLFEAALVHGIYANSVFTTDKRTFGEDMTKLIIKAGDGNLAAAMALALGDSASRAIAIRVSRRHVTEPLAEWLGPPNATGRAINMVALLTGFSLQLRHIGPTKVPSASKTWLAESLQAIVDQGIAGKDGPPPPISPAA